MRVSATPIAGFAAGRALALLFAGLVLVALAVLWAPGPSVSPELPGPGDPSAPVTSTEPGSLTDPNSTGAREPRWEPGVVLPPDSPIRAGTAPTAAIVRGRIVAANWVTWPRSTTVLLTRQSDGKECGRAEPTQDAPEFRFEEVPFGDYRLSLQASEFEELVMLISASTQAPDLFQTMPLTPAASVRGRVRDSEGNLVPEILVTVELRVADPRQPVLPIEGRTDAAGEFRIPGLRPGEYDVYPGAARSAVGASVAVFLGPGAPEAWADLEVSGLGTARVVLEDLDAAGLAGVSVQALMMKPAGAIGAYQETRAATADGKVDFRWLPPGEYGFTVFGGAFRRTLREGTVQAGAVAEVRIPLRPAVPKSERPR
jgi:hypothetical protein